jgi:hypothetical protein
MLPGTEAAAPDGACPPHVVPAKTRGRSETNEKRPTRQTKKMSGTIAAADIFFNNFLLETYKTLSSLL